MEIRALLFSLLRSKTGPFLVAAQVALTFVVIVNLASVITQCLDASSRPTGMDLPDMFWLSTQPLSGTPDQAHYAAAVKADLAWLNAQPGVVAAAAVSPLPQTFTTVGLPLSSNPRDLERPEGGQSTVVYMGSERFLDAMGLKLIAGRNFKSDAVQPPAVTPQGISPANAQASLASWGPELIVTQQLARALFPDGSALGKTVHAGVVNKPAVIVGIVDLMRANPVAGGMDASATRVAITPVIPAGPRGVYVVRTQPGRRDALMARIGRELGDLQPNRFVSRIEAYDITAARARTGYHTAILLLGGVAVLLLLVTVAGIVGLAAYHVAARTRQLGTRRALGARRFHILRYFLLENWLTTTAGVALGCLPAIGVGVALSLVLQIPRLSLVTLAGGALLLWVVGWLAVLIPALRAASTSPAIATRMV